MSVQMAARTRGEMERALDAIASNRRQARAGFNPGGRIDSVLEGTALIRGLLERALSCGDLDAETRELLDKARRTNEIVDYCGGLVYEENGREHQLERHLAGNLEGMAAEQFSASARLRLNHRELARMLRPVLEDLEPGTPADRYSPAVTAWKALRVLIPMETLTSPTLARELTRAPAATLARLLEIETARGGRS